MSKIMVVDDEVLITAQLQEYIKTIGYDVVGTAHSGEEAVSKARELKPDLILMDIMMDGGKMDGISASEIIKRELDIHVIFITAYGNEKIINRAKTVEPIGFITKPYSEQELKAAIELGLYRLDRERQLKTSEERYRSVVASAIEAIIIIDIHMKIVFWNKAAGSMFGHKVGQIEGKPFTHLISPKRIKELGVEMDRMVLIEESNPVAKTTETVGLRSEGGEFPMEFSLASWIIRDEIFFTVNARDITDRKKIEQMKTDFVSLVSHQMKTPVAGILGCIDNLLAGLAGPITPQQKEYLLIMKEISQRNFRNISDLLNISRLERGIVEANLKLQNLKAVIAGVVREYHIQIAQKGLALELEGWSDRYEVAADRDKLFESVCNVVNNAIKFTEKGTISIRLKKSKKDAHVEIEDTGQGIPYEMQNNMFKRDMILRGAPDVNRGSGLGLFIAKEFMKLQKGDISVRSKPGEGSCFTFQIPLVKSNTAGEG